MAAGTEDYRAGGFGFTLRDGRYPEAGTRSCPHCMGLAPLNVLYGLPLKQLADLGVARVSTGSLLFRMTLGTLRDWAQGHPNEAVAPGYDEIAALV